MKGITPVVAVILLLLVTIAIVGFAFGFFNRVLSTAGAGGENQTSEAVLKAAKTISIENVDPNTGIITIRNIGTQAISVIDLSVYYNLAANTCPGAAWAPMPLLPRATANCGTINPLGPCASGTTIRIVAPGNEATIRC